MFGKSVKIFNLFGFEVKVDFSWLILAVLITWTLASGLFPAYFKDFSTSTYWWMGVAGAIGLFISIVFHEFSHSMVARNFGIPMRGITLFIFGGVAEMHEEPKNAKSELFMAVAGPIASIIIGGVFYGFHLIGRNGLFSQPVHGVLVYLAYLNLILAAFNMIPAFPLDGGRVLRSALWAWKNDLKWATRISSRIGSGFGIVLIVLGVFSFINGNFIGGVWWFLIGMFIRGASQQSYQQLLMRRELEGEPVSRFMKKDPVTVSSSLSVDDLVEDYIYKFHYKFFPVVDNSSLKGCVHVKQVKNIPKEERKNHTVGELAEQCSDNNSIDINTDAVKALSMMRKSGNSRLMVVDNGKLVGIISLKDLLEFLSMKVDLEED
ncbi:MAG: site-2 protease family protein [Calditrichaeota bacterium]|nr:site-2 protease family protein [Calditrichota bacterium]RQW01141.1 MAG: site-2 protease family protein [Calditrichota bacterium]